MIKTIFMGSPDFALPTLKRLAQAYQIVGVVTQPDREAGRGRVLTAPPVKLLAQELDLPVMQPARLREPAAMEQLFQWSPDLIVVAAFGQILRPAVLDLPRFGCINVHGSLLPRHRGAAPIQAAILSGDAQTGVTIMKMDPGVDTGPMLAQQTLRITPDDTASTLSQRMAEMGAQLLIETLPAYLAGELLPQPQPTEGATYAPMLKKEDGELDFNQPADDLARRVRAFSPWPGAFTTWQGRTLKILSAHAVNTPESLAAHKTGKELVYQGLPAVVCGAGLLVIDEIQPAGKNSMTGKGFLNGARAWGNKL